MKYTRNLAMNFVLVILLPAVGIAEPSLMVVGSEGTVLKVQSGAYEDLFPGGPQGATGSHVLALDQLRPEGMERFLVPGTENFESEVVAALHYDKDSDLTHLLWEGLVNGVHPFLYLESFNGSQWSEQIPIADSVFADKGSAHLVIMPESEPKPKTALATESRAADIPAKRTVMYVTWHEVAPIGVESFLVPIIFEDGKYLGWRQIYNLSDFLNDAVKVGALPRSVMDANLREMLTIQPSARGNAVAVGFIDRESGHFVSLEFELLPLALSMMSERVKELLLQYSESSETVDELIEQVQAAMLAEGVDFHLGVLEYLANQLRELLANQPTVEAAVAPPVLEKIGLMMVDIGARVRRKGLVDLEPLGIYALGQTANGGAPYHYLKVSLLAKREAPKVEGPATLFLSRTGEKALVAWADDKAVYYRETAGEAWEDTQRVQLREGLDQSTMYRILSERTQNR